jgi:hypothetical protein
MLIEEILPVGSITAVVGPTYSGKTFFALEAACAVAFGRPFMGKWAVPLPGNVLFIEQDSPKYDTGRALYAMLREDITRLEATPEGAHRLRALQIAWHQRLSLSRTEDVARIIETANKLWTPLGFTGHEEHGFAGTNLIILDTFRRLHTAQENDATEIQEILDRMDFIKEHTGAAILFLHHVTKARPDNPATLRGSTAIEGAVDNIFRITRKKRDPLIRVEVEKARAIQPPEFYYTIDTKEENGNTTKTVRFDSAPEGETNTTTSSPGMESGKPSGPDRLLAFLNTLQDTLSNRKTDAVEWGKLNGISRSTVYRWLRELEERQV